MTPPTLNLEHATSLTVCGSYDSPLGVLIKELKYDAITEQAETLAQIIWYCCSLPNVEAVSYIPMHIHKQKQREFNQTQLVARRLATRLNLPVVQYVKKHAQTEALALSHSKNQRLEIIGNSFSIRTDTTLPIYKSILLIDDVITTGTTFNAVTSVLHHHYPQLETHCLAIAHRG